MPRPGMKAPEKSKDFFGSIKRLIKNLNPWKYILSLALILAMVSAILGLIAPNRLSDFADTLTEGIKPDTKKLESISKEIFTNINFENIYLNMWVTPEDYEKTNEVINKLSEAKTEEEKLELIISLPDSVLKNLLKDIKVDNKIINVSDQVKFIKLMNIDENVSQEDMLNKFDELPKSIYELVKPKIDMDKIKDIATLLIVLYVTSAVFNYIQSFSMATVSNKFAKTLRTKISSKINKLPLKYFDSHETGDILSRITNDVDMVAQNLNNSLATLVTSITLFLGSIIMMFITNWIMALTAIASSLIGFVFMSLILGKSQKYFIKRQEELGNLNGYIEEIYSGHMVVKAYNGVEGSKKEFRKLNKQLYEANRKSQFLSGLMHPVMGFVGNFGYVAVCLVGALLTMNDIITFGVIVAFMIYVRMFTNPLTQIAQAMTSLQSTAAASERVFEFLDEKEMTDESDLRKKLSKTRTKGKIEFKNVKFGYNPGKAIIKNFSATANPGEKIAIVGPTGAGKTTMVNLLMKFYEINDGEIIIDGVSTKDLSRENIHDLFIMVLQDTWLFEATIRDNIKYNKENVSDEEIWQALKTVGVAHFVKSLPNGLDYVLSDNESISAGQKQLLTIARGMIKDAPFLILDEATSNVDTRTEELVQKAMDKLMEGRTSFIIAHRLSTIKNADKILVMNEGDIIEQGSHDELMEQNGFYADLYNSQFKKN